MQMQKTYSGVSCVTSVLNSITDFKIEIYVFKKDY